LYDFNSNQIEELDDNMQIKKINVLRYGRLASEAEPFDAMEKAIVEAYHLHLNPAGDNGFHMVHEYPLSGQPPMMTHVYRSGDVQLIAAKGAPERILRICKLDELTKRKMESIILQMASSGYRVLGVCSVTNHLGEYPAEQDDFNWKFEGLLALYDPPKKNASEEFSFPTE